MGEDFPGGIRFEVRKEFDRFALKGPGQPHLELSSGAVQRWAGESNPLGVEPIDSH